MLWRDRRFLTLAAGKAAGLFAQIGLLAHLFSIMVPVFGPRSAGLLMGGATAAAILGRAGIGWLMPVSADRRLIASASYGVQIIGTLILLTTGGGNTAVMVVGVLLSASASATPHRSHLSSPRRSSTKPMSPAWCR